MKGARGGMHDRVLLGERGCDFLLEHLVWQPWSEAVVNAKGCYWGHQALRSWMGSLQALSAHQGGSPGGASQVVVVAMLAGWKVSHEYKG
jgi:hypothetical protein